MIHDTRRGWIPDVCVVGAGPAGMTVALELGSAGRSVLLIESGGFVSALRDQELNDADHDGIAYDGLGRTRHRQVGGTANVWNVPFGGGLGAKYVPLSARDMADWPISWRELEPFYREAQVLCGLGPFEYGSNYWATPDRRPFVLEGTGLCSGVYQFGSAEVFTRLLVDRLKASETVSIFPSTTVTRLVMDDRPGRVSGVLVVDSGGRAHEIKARSLILACGAVENARLLMMSQASQSAWLGRGFMEHARDVLLLVPETPELFARASFYDLHTSRGVWIGGRLALSNEALDALRLPNASMTLTARRRSTLDDRSLLGRVVRSIGRLVGGERHSRYGWSKIREPARAFDAFRVIMNLEQRPNPANRVELSARCDRLGNPLPHLILGWTDEEQRLLGRLRELLAEGCRSARLGRVIVDRDARPDLSAHHHAGTTRMGISEEDGVVDSEGKVFGRENLHLAGASVFPSAGFANPTLTIVALAIRLARHVDRSLG